MMLFLVEHLVNFLILFEALEIFEDTRTAPTFILNYFTNSNIYKQLNQ